MTDDSVKILSFEELPPTMRATFEQIYRLKSRIKALKAEHIEPIAAEITALWRDLKAGSEMTRKDLELVYRIAERLWDAKAMDDEAEGERIQKNIQRAFSAAKRGEIIDLVDILNSIDGADEQDDGDFEEDVSQAEQQLMGDVERESAVVAREHLNEPRSDAQEGVAGPDADWGDDDQHPVPAEDDDGSKAGFAFQEGERYGLAGNTDLKKAIKGQHGKHMRSAWAKSFVAGHAQGFKKFQAAQAAAEQQEQQIEDTPDNEGADVLQFRQPVPLPATQVLETPGDVA